METDGGGWTLVLNYLHKGNTSPQSMVRTIASGLPLLDSTVLGTDESASFHVGGSWGHLSNAAFSQVSP